MYHQSGYGSSARSQGPAAPQVLGSPESQEGGSEQAGRGTEETEQDGLRPTAEQNPNSVGLRLKHTCGDPAVSDANQWQTASDGQLGIWQAQQDTGDLA